MSTKEMFERLGTKTPEGEFLRILQKEFNFSFRVSGEVLSAVQETLLGLASAARLRPGQIRLVVASENAPFSPALADCEKVEVTLTIDAGIEDTQFALKHGSIE